MLVIRPHVCNVTFDFGRKRKVTFGCNGEFLITDKLNDNGEIVNGRIFEIDDNVLYTRLRKICGIGKPVSTKIVKVLDLSDNEIEQLKDEYELYDKNTLKFSLMESHKLKVVYGKHEMIGPRNVSTCFSFKKIIKTNKLPLCTYEYNGFKIIEKENEPILKSVKNILRQLKECIANNNGVIPQSLVGIPSKNYKLHLDRSIFLNESVLDGSILEEFEIFIELGIKRYYEIKTCPRNKSARK